MIKFVFYLQCLALTLMALVATDAKAQSITLSATDAFAQTDGEAIVTVSADINDMNTIGCRFNIRGDMTDRESITVERFEVIENAFTGTPSVYYDDQSCTVTLVDNNHEPMNSGAIMRIVFRIGHYPVGGIYNFSLEYPEVISNADDSLIYQKLDYDVPFTIAVSPQTGLAKSAIMYATDVYVGAGGTATAAIGMGFDEETEVHGCQFFLSGDMVDGEHVTIQSVNEIDEAFGSKARVEVSKYKEKKHGYLIYAYDSEHKPMKTGFFMTITFKVDESVPIGVYNLLISDIEILHEQELLSSTDVPIKIEVTDPIRCDITATDMETFTGTSAESVMSLDTELPNGILGMQFCVTVPSGITIEKVEAIEEAFEGVPEVHLLYKKSKRHYIVKVSCKANEPMCMGEGAIDFLKLKIKSSELLDAPEQYTVEIKDFKVSYSKDGHIIAAAYPAPENILVTLTLIPPIQCEIYAADLEIQPGREGETLVGLSSDLPDGVVGISFLVNMPEEISFEGIEAVTSAFVMPPTVGYSYDSNRKKYAVSVGSAGNSSFCKGSDFVDFLKLKLKASTKAVVGNAYAVELSEFDVTYKKAYGVIESVYPIPEDVQFNVTIAVPTGIEDITEQDQAASVYSLNGVRMSGSLPKGVYVRDGKKVVVK